MSKERQVSEEQVEGGAVAESATDGPLDDSEAAEIVGGSGGTAAPEQQDSIGTVTPRRPELDAVLPQD